MAFFMIQNLEVKTDQPTVLKCPITLFDNEPYSLYFYLFIRHFPRGDARRRTTFSLNL
jgi:hypothetical protein